MVNPKLGMVNLAIDVLRFFSKPYDASVPVAELTEMFTPGVTDTCEYLATADPAGLIVTAPRSPPRAVNALPMATVLAVPA